MTSKINRYKQILDNKSRRTRRIREQQKQQGATSKSSLKFKSKRNQEPFKFTREEDRAAVEAQLGTGIPLPTPTQPVKSCENSVVLGGKCTQEKDEEHQRNLLESGLSSHEPETSNFSPEIATSTPIVKGSSWNSFNALRSTPGKFILDPKATKKLRAIREAISLELRNSPGPKKSVVLRGLRKAAKRLQGRESALSKRMTPLREIETLGHQAAITKARQVSPNILLNSSRFTEKITAHSERFKPTEEVKFKIMGNTPADASAVDHLYPEDQDMNDPSFQDQESPKIYELTDECHHYTTRQDAHWDIQNYWEQRYSIFSLYDEGIQMTDDSWFGVTPEPVANKVAEDLAAITSESKSVLIDMFAGAGGNVIAFALSERWSHIIAIEKDPSVIACAQHNAAIYGVAEYITWVNDDSFSYLESKSSSIDRAKTVIFASPPWGGPGYRSDKIFNLNTMAPYSIKQIHAACKGMQSALYLPRTSDLRQIASLAPDREKVEVVQYCMQGASKALVAFVPASAP